MHFLEQLDYYFDFNPNNLTLHQGLIAQIHKNLYESLLRLQKNLISKTVAVGCIDYEYWRTYTVEQRQEKLDYFIDGDLIETFLDMNQEQMSKMIEGIKVGGILH